SSDLPQAENDPETHSLPGANAFIPVKIENNTSDKTTYIISVTTSYPAIASVIKEDSIAIPGRGSRLYIAPVRIAPDALEGAYKISLQFTNKQSGDHFTKTAIIHVGRLKKISLTTISSPEYLRAGETIDASFQLKNNGNTSERLVLESNQGLGIDSNILLEPGGSKIIHVKKLTDPGLKKNEAYNIYLCAYSLNDEKNKSYAYAS